MCPLMGFSDIWGCNEYIRILFGKNVINGSPSNMVISKCFRLTRKGILKKKEAEIPGNSHLT